jgi:Lipoate synthase
MILGKTCTRNCTFCNISKGKAGAVDPAEPDQIARAVKELGLKHAVITSVTRDDLDDGGAHHFVQVIQAIKRANPGVTVEVLIPDFAGNFESLLEVVRAKPEIINHNIETVPRLYPEVRPLADFQRSLNLLQNVKQADSSIYTKSGIMVGLGEESGEVVAILKDLKKTGCDFLTIGQYLAPSQAHHPVVEYVHPDIFENYRREALNIGFKYVASGPFVRSSYHAEQTLKEHD